MREPKVRFESVDPFIPHRDLHGRVEGGSSAGEPAEIAHELRIVRLKRHGVAVGLRSLPRHIRIANPKLAFDQSVARLFRVHIKSSSSKASDPCASSSQWPF